MTGTTTAADYAWLEEQYEDLLEAYCVTLVQGLTPEERSVASSTARAAPTARRRSGSRSCGKGGASR
nr:DUF6461 domain-containing protein [Streptomyces dysideae]